MINLINTVHAAVTNPSVPTTPFGTGVTPTLIPQCALQDGGASTLECVLELFINISQVLLGVVGSVLLVVFIYGGIMYLFSQGEPGRVAKGQKALTGGVVGLIIVFTAFIGVSYTINALMGENDEMISELVTCGTYYTMPDGKVVDNSINNGEVCAPGGFTCTQGACCLGGNCNPPEPAPPTPTTP
ncbi:hypothetical protein HQ524_00285 [Candidatus Uhrbacteria bacterium]|nr:hypothetical protein [Candidatus Uhrbacteria bacterium]